MAGKVGVENAAGWSFHLKPYRRYHYKGAHTVPNALGWVDLDGSVPKTVEILSVTQALGVIDKSGPLQYYAANETLAGCATLLRKYGLVKDSDGHLPAEVDLEDLCLIAGDPKYLGGQLYRNGLTFSQKTDDAAERGTALHTVQEDWIEHGRLPDPSKHHPSRRGYVRGFAGFLASTRPTFLESEAIVGSLEHGFAGARDTVLTLRDPKRGLCLVDLKTSKSVYPSSHFRQVTAYDRGGVMCGQEPTDSQGVLRVGKDGSWEIQWLQDFGSSDFFWRGFLSALATARDERAISKVTEREYRARKKAEKAAAP